MSGITVNKVHLYNTGEGFEQGQVVSKVGDTFQGGLVNGVAYGLFAGDRFKSADTSSWLGGQHCVIKEGELVVAIKGKLPAKSGMIPLVDIDGFIYGAGYLEYTDAPSYLEHSGDMLTLKSYSGELLYPSKNLRFVTDGMHPVVGITETI